MNDLLIDIYPLRVPSTTFSVLYGSVVGSAVTGSNLIVPIPEVIFFSVTINSTELKSGVTSCETSLTVSPVAIPTN